MGVTAENLASKYGISREECDTFALLSQTRWAEAQKGGKFKDEIVPVTIKVKGKDVLVDVDEHPRPDTTMEKLAKLGPAFKKDGVVTAGNASGINDGAGALVLASEDAVKAKGLGALTRVVAYAVVGCDPTIMGKFNWLKFFNIFANKFFLITKKLKNYFRHRSSTSNS